MSFADFRQQQQALQTVFLAQFKGFRQKGIVGSQAFCQVIDDYRRQCKQPAESKLNRVEWAFEQLPYEKKVNLLAFADYFAQKEGKNVEQEHYKPFAEFSRDERSFIACALKEMGVIRDIFPKNLRFQEFHPKGAA